MAFHEGAFYVGNPSTFPIVDGSSKILKIALAAGGLRDRIHDDSRGGIRQARAASLPREHGWQSVPDDIIASGLSVPTAMTLGHDANLCLSNFGFGYPPARLGHILKTETAEDEGD
ncbi:MAG TPA: hypothetical protein VH041_06690 [Caldimonas sp.]|jgi:hypothetical protein|nr:hypothetical protein [Caldimonas sp.]HEX4233976.1 hypothetical protein [Caldimonas sp.]